MAHKKLDWIQFEIFKVQKKLHTKHFRNLGWNGWSQHPHDQKNKLHQISVYNVAISYKSKRVSSELNVWTSGDVAKEMFSGKGEETEEPHEDQWTHELTMLDWTDAYFLRWIEAALRESISFDFRNLAGGGHHRGSIRGWSQTSRLSFFFEYNSADSAMSRNMFFLDVPSRMLSQMWIQSSWSRICHKGVLLPELFGRCRVRNRLLIRL